MENSTAPFIDVRDGEDLVHGERPQQYENRYDCWCLGEDSHSLAGKLRGIPYREEGARRASLIVVDRVGIRIILEFIVIKNNGFFNLFIGTRFDSTPSTL